MALQSDYLIEHSDTLGLDRVRGAVDWVSDHPQSLSHCRTAAQPWNARSAAHLGSCMGTNFFPVLLGGLLALLMTGCERGPSGDGLVSQTKRILSEARPGCTIDVVFNGVGEGDADNAYATIRLETGSVDGRRSKDVEVLISDLKSDRWDIQQEGSAQLVDAAIQLCRR